MKQMRIIDSNFGPSKYHRNPWNFEWDRTTHPSKVCFYTDNCLEQAKTDDAEIKVAWLYEPIAIQPAMYDWIQRNHEHFNIIFTHCMDLVNLYPQKFKFYPHGNCWILDEDLKPFVKTRYMSIIASGKMQTPGHKLRHEVIRTIQSLDVYGNGYNFVEYKLDALKDYQYQIVIENSIQDDYFTEKIIDCFATGTIPIYYGTRNINKYFKDVPVFHTMEELQSILANLPPPNPETINHNFNESMKYILAEEWIYSNYTKLFEVANAN